MTTFSVNDQTYDLQDIYGAGHTVNEPEAAVLNEVRARKLAAAWGQRIRQAVKAGREYDTSQAALEQYASTYKLGDMPKGPGGKGAKDPYAAEAKKVATELLVAHVKAMGQKRADIANFDQLVADLSAREDIVARAKERVEAAKSISVGELPLEVKPAPTEPELPEGGTVEPAPQEQGEIYGPPAPKNRRRG